MPPRLPRVSIGPSSLSRIPITLRSQQLCPICYNAKALRPKPSRRRSASLENRSSSRAQSKLASASSSYGEAPVRISKARNELRYALADLQKSAGSYVNISRLQLALRGLDQPVGQETIRIALLQMRSPGRGGLQTVKQLLRLLLADPLKAEEEWERILMTEGSEGKPMLLKVGFDDADVLSPSNALVSELNVSSPLLKGHKMEILVLDLDPVSLSGNDTGDWTEALLVPTMEIPTSSSGRYTPVTTPVHKSFIVAEGLQGAAAILQLPAPQSPDLVQTAVNFGSAHLHDAGSLRIIDIDKAKAALKSFRSSVDNAILYEQEWFASGVPKVLEFLKDDTAPMDDSMKAPLRSLIDTLLSRTSLKVSEEDVRRKFEALSTKMSSSKSQALREALKEWAERAHTELRDSLDVAFNGRRWRKLGWWKLFWRVDDVSMIATDILNQRFLTDAERELIYFAGVINEALSRDAPIKLNENWAYKPVVKQEATGMLTHAPPPRYKDIVEMKDDSAPKVKPQPWPLDIPVTRDLLATDTVPALQALAQKLVLQTLSTSAFSSGFAGLIYVSTLSTSLYEAGAVAALGTVWSLRRLQGKWETARTFWEGEVREEGRKAVRGVESVITNALVQPDHPLEGAEDRQKAKDALEKATLALELCK